MSENNKIYSEISGVYVDELDFLMKKNSSSCNRTIEYNQVRTIGPQGYVSNIFLPTLDNEEVSKILSTINCDGQYHADCDEEMDHLADDEKEMSLESTMSFQSDSDADSDVSMEDEMAVMNIAAIIVEYAGIARTRDEAMANLLSNAMDNLVL